MPLPKILVEYAITPHSAHVPVSAYTDDPAEQALYLARPATGLRFGVIVKVNGKPVCEAEIDDPSAAPEAVELVISAVAKSKEVDFPGMREALRRALKCTDDAAFAIALAFTFPPGPLAFEHVRFRWVAPRKRGHPVVAGALTRHLYNLALGWEEATGMKPGTAERSYFIQALVAAQPYIPWLVRRDGKGEIEDLRKVVRTEMKKFDFDKVEWVRAPWSP
jgi:hypothetical protein